MITTEHPQKPHVRPSTKAPSTDTAPKRPLIILNDDTCSLRYVDEPHTEEAVGIPLRHLAGTQVGAICWCMGDDVALSWPSKVIENYYDQLAAGHYIGLFDDDAGFGGVLKGKGEYYEKLKPGEEPRNLMLTLHRQGIDYLPILIDRARRMDIKFYGSFRMNDCHLKSDPRGMYSSKFWQEHQHYRLWEVTDGRTYYNAAMDFSHPEVRTRKLDAMRETLQWYDMDGIELDFCRNPYVFQPSEAWAKRNILTDFIRSVRKDLDEAGQRWGRKLDLILRVPFDDRKLREAGMDVNVWLDERLIDVLVMSGWLNDYNQSIEPWAAKCRENGVAFYPSVEMGPAHNAIHNHITIEKPDETIQRQRAAAQNYIGQGAAGVYMFNYPCVLFQTRRSPEQFAELSRVFSEMGREETLAGTTKQYPFWKNLPMQVESRRPAQFHQTIRFSLFDPDLENEQTKIRLSFRQATEPNPHVDARHFDKPPEILPAGWVEYHLNGQQVPESWIQRTPQPEGPISSGLTLSAHEKVTLSPPASVLRQGENTLGFFVPRFPEEHDPYIQIYELIVGVNARD